MHKIYNPPQICPPFANYSHAVAASGKMLFLSGQLGVLPDGSLPQSAYAQSRQCLANINAILSEAGLSSRHVVHLRSFVTDRRYLADYMRARDEWVVDLTEPPASTLIIVSGFARPEMTVEIEATACFDL
ncbi:MAG: RidA family protein [Rhodobacteraceae bacterium]|nr:RidA family protein [Paracoccaceae bacterium]MCY4195418.1 RidA family protein [Paracoccaceae bacterium]MCY4326038.1 RidA family protein [Paracoccaceae bacterium]